MPRHHHAQMDPASRAQTLPWLPLSGTFALLILLVFGGVGFTRSAGPVSASSPGSRMLVHWRDASHDWLLIGDGQSDQLTVYGALDGRLLRRIPFHRGLSDANALAQRDGHLFVVGDDGELGELALPQLTLVASSGP